MSPRNSELALVRSKLAAVLFVIVLVALVAIGEYFATQRYVRCVHPAQPQLTTVCSPPNPGPHGRGYLTRGPGY